VIALRLIVAQDAAPSAARVAAAALRLDRGWGKTVQPIAGGVASLTIFIRQILEPADVDVAPLGPTSRLAN
jgi:hypothetical protein